MTAIALERRLANFRAAQPRGSTTSGSADREDRLRATLIGAERLAATLDGELIRTPTGAFVRVEAPSIAVPIDRDRLAVLPGQPPSDAPLLCLDTETTGLATAAGTLAFLVGLGWWEGARFRQVQLLLPDHADEPALLAELAARIPPDGWLVTYNGRGFDWPLLVARYRMARGPAPAHAGHLDLLPIVRRVFRHRMPDARLRTAEAELLGLHRVGDVDGWEIPARYLEFLRSAEPGPLVDVVRHNHEDVRSLARLVAHLDTQYADAARRCTAPPGDLAGLAAAFTRERRFAEALACLDSAVEGAAAVDRAAGRDTGSQAVPAARPSIAVRDLEPVRVRVWGSGSGDDEPWWSPRRRPDFGGRAGRYAVPGWRAAAPERLDAAWSDVRVAAARARLLRRVGRARDAEAAWLELADRGGAIEILALIEAAKLREHHRADPAGALDLALRAIRAAERRRALGTPMPRGEADLRHRVARLRARVDRQSLVTPPTPGARPARRRTDPSDGTPSSPGRSIASDAAAAASRASPPLPGGPASRSGASRAAISAARKTSPAPVGSTTASGGIAG